MNGGEPPPPTAPLIWRPTGAPQASSRTDDIWFQSPEMGWLVNSNGQIMRTDDGGVTWVEQFHDEGLYLRCIAFASDTRGWVGTLTPARPWKRSHSDFLLARWTDQVTDATAAVSSCRSEPSAP